MFEGRSEWWLKDIDEFSMDEGKLCEPNDGYANIDIPRDILIENFDDPIVAIF